MYDDSYYNKIRLLHDLARITWFIDKHGRDDAKKVDDGPALALLDELDADIKKHLCRLTDMVKKG